MTDRPLPAGRADIVFRPLGREWVLYDPASREMHVLNLTAALVWSHLDGATSTAEVVAELGETLTDAPEPQRVALEVERVVDDFRDKGLLA